MKPLLSASILSADWLRFGAEAEAMLQAGIDSLHLDVMDYQFVPNLTIGPPICQSLRQHFPNLPLDVHLMTTTVDPLIMDFAKAGASTIYIHPESTLHLHRSLMLIREQGCQTGVVLNPATPIDVLTHISSLTDNVMLMTVNPGFAGQAFIDGMLDKIQATAAWRQKQQLSFRIAVDGGVQAGNIQKIAKHGADTFIAGSALFKGDYAQTIKQFRQALAD